MSDPDASKDQNTAEDTAGDSADNTADNTAGAIGRLRYSLITGQDTSEFCERVSAALDQGYQLYGSPTLVFDPDQGTRVAAQAVVLPG